MRRIVLLAALYTLCFWLAGCATVPVVVHSHNPFNPPVADLQSWLSKFFLFGVLLIAAGLALYFFAPEAHGLSFTIGGIGLSLEGVSLITKIFLGFIPWIVGILFVAAAGFFVYEYFENKTAIDAAVKKAV